MTQERKMNENIRFILIWNTFFVIFNNEPFKFSLHYGISPSVIYIFYDLAANIHLGLLFAKLNNLPWYIKLSVSSEVPKLIHNIHLTHIWINYELENL